MKRLLTGALVGVLMAGLRVLAAESNVNVQVQADVEVGKKPGTTESLTVIQPGPAGETRVMTKEVTTAPETEKTPRKDVPADTTPRKARVVVVPAIYAQEIRSKFERELNEKWGLTDPSVIENPGYTGFLVDALVNCRKFDVLEREALKSAIKELDFAESDYADVAKCVRLGRVLNADYVVVPEIRYMGLLLEQQEVPYVGQKQNILKGKLSTNLRTVDVATSKIVSSSMGDVGVTNRLRNVAESPASPVRDLIDKLYAESGLKEAANIIDVAYPIKVVALAEKTVVLNRGEGAIKEGEVLNVYRPGEMMVDPDTKESLGYHEARVGQVKVAKVDEKTCTAEILEGAGTIEKLNICRRDVKPAPAAPLAPAPKLD